MPLAHNLFAPKLNELDAEYTQMISKIKLCHRGTLDEVIQAKDALWTACKEQETQLEEVISASRSKAVAELSAMQLHYFQEIRSALEKKIPQQLDTMRKDTETGRAEAMALYAEFAIDTAIQSMRYALHAALSAVELQLKAKPSGND